MVSICPFWCLRSCTFPPGSWSLPWSQQEWVEGPHAPCPPPPATEDTIKSACSSGDLEGHLRTLLYVYLTAEEPHWYPMCREPLRVCPALTFPVSSWGFTGLCRNSKSEHWLLLFSIFLP